MTDGITPRSRTSAAFIAHLFPDLDARGRHQPIEAVKTGNGRLDRGLTRVLIADVHGDGEGAVEILRRFLGRGRVDVGASPRDLFADILRRIDRLRTTPLPT